MDYFTDNGWKYQDREWKYTLSLLPLKYLDEYYDIENGKPQRCPRVVKCSTTDLSTLSCRSMVDGFEKTYRQSMNMGDKPYFLFDKRKLNQSEPSNPQTNNEDPKP